MITVNRNSSPVIFQDNALTNAHYQMSELEKNIFYSVQNQLSNKDLPDQEYTVRVQDLTQYTDSENLYQNLRKATERMMQQILYIPLADQGFLQVAPFSSVKYLTGEGLMIFRIDPNLLPYLLNLKKHFTIYGYKEALSLSGKHTKRIYEILSMFKNLGVVKLDLLELKTRLKLYNPDTGKEDYTNFNMMATRVLNPAVEEINSKSNLRVSYTPVKTSRKVTHLSWTISQQYALREEASEPELLQRLVREFGLRTDQATQILTEFDVPAIHKKLHEIQMANLNKKISNWGAYTAKAFGM
jgi:plasmid replication initiation protein